MPSDPAPSTTRKIALLASLYFSQGLPYGFFTAALPVWMRQQGLSLTLIGLTSLLALPWGLKLLWSGLVDSRGGSPLGRRRGWILPLQCLTVAAIVVLAVVGDSAGTRSAGLSPEIVAMGVAMLVTNLFAATQDIATDGLAVDLLSSLERGLGNGVQVAAYRVGMIVGGGALLAGFDALGWTTTLLVMAALLAVMTIPIALHREAPSSSRQPVSLLAPLHFLGRGGGRMIAWVLGIAIYKIGDALGAPMARALLVDKGFDAAEIGLLLGTLGSLAGMAGAMLGGVVVRRGRLLALVTCGLVHAALMASYALPVVFELDAVTVGALLILEHVTGGMATASLFTAMMDAADARTGASDYTVQASVVVLASGAGSSLSGISADAIGYAPHFALAGVVCAVGSLVMIPLYRARIAPHDPGFDDELAVPSPVEAVSSSVTSAAVSSTSHQASPPT